MFFQSESVDAQEFNGFIVRYIVIFLISVSSLVTSHFILCYFRCSIHQEDLIIDKQDHSIYQFVNFICSIVLSVCLVGYLALPFTIFINEILPTIHVVYFDFWLNNCLISDLFSLLNASIKISLVLLPFAWFLIHSQGFAGSRSTIFSRIIESVLSVSLLYIVVFGALWAAWKDILTIFDTDYFNSLHLDSESDDFTLYSLVINLFYNAFDLFLVLICPAHMIFAFCGLIMMHICMPLGLISIVLQLLDNLKKSLSSIVPSVHRTKERYDQVSLEYKYLLMQEYTDEFVSITCDKEQDSKQKQRKQLLFDEIKILEINLNFSWFKRVLIWCSPFCFGVLIIGFITLLVLVVIAVFFNIFNICIGLVFGINPENETHEFIINTNFSSRLGRFGAIIQVLLVHFLLVTSLWGFYFSRPLAPRIRLLRPKPHRTRIDQVLANLTFILLVTSALPLQSALLGFTAITPLDNNILAPLFIPRSTSLQLASYPSKKPASVLNNDPNTGSGLNDETIIFTKPSSFFSSMLSTSDEQNTLIESSGALNRSAQIFKDIIGHFLPIVIEKTVETDSSEMTKCYSPKNGPTRPAFILATWIYRLFVGSRSPESSDKLACPPTRSGSLFVLLCYNVGFLLTSYLISGPILLQASRGVWIEMQHFLSLHNFQTTFKPKTSNKINPVLHSNSKSVASNGTNTLIVT